MKKINILLALLIYSTLQIFAAPGDIVIIGFNADGDDDFAFVVMRDLPANEMIRFCDSEWTGTAFGTDENDWTWVNPLVTLKGTVIVINKMGGPAVANLGVVTGTTGFSASDEAIFAYKGELRLPVEFHAAISNNSASAFGTLTGTGLNIGTTAIILTSTADMAAYNGPRTGLDNNGYLVAFNNMTNWQIQDATGDQFNDGIAPDLPFSTSPFSFSSFDTTTPEVTNVSVLGQMVLEVFFSEQLSKSTAENPENYLFTPSIAIESIIYNEGLKKVTINHKGFGIGDSTKISVSGIMDLVSNTMKGTYKSGPLYFNNLSSGLYITEIMYNAPSDQSDNLEFIEIFNGSASSLKVGGIKVTDKGNFNVVLPQQNLAKGEFILLSSDTLISNQFYKKKFLPLTKSGSVTNNLGNGGESFFIENTTGQNVFTVTYDDASPWPLTPDGGGSSLELNSLTVNANDGNNWSASSVLAGVTNGNNVYASPGSFTSSTKSLVSFGKSYLIFNENSALGTIEVKITGAPTADATVDLKVLSGFGNAVANTDFTRKDTILTFKAGSNSSIFVPVKFALDGGLASKFFALDLSNIKNAVLGSIPQTVIYIKNTNQPSFPKNDVLGLKFVSSFKVDDSGGSAEIVAFESTSNRLFVINSLKTFLEILDFSNPASIKKIKTIDMTQYGKGATSVSISQGIVAVTVDGNTTNEKGHVVFFTSDGTYLNKVEVGYLPDMLTFSSDGNLLLVANEGEPTVGYTFDPIGSVSLIDMSKGVKDLNQDDVTDINFTAFDSQETELKAAGVRIFGLNSSVSKDLEPEYITISKDKQKAWVSLQENNAYAEINLTTKTVSRVSSFGLKDLNVAYNALDFSDKNDSVLLSYSQNLKGMYMPDAIDSYEVGKEIYLVTANEGDQREWDVIDEDVKVSDLNLDPVRFPNANLLKKDYVLGKLNVTPYSGDIDKDGDFDELHSFGTRSFSIFNATSGALVYDSKNDFELINSINPVTAKMFNASNSGSSFKNRSDNKGPEPEGLEIAEIAGKTYAFIGLERIGGVMVYDITNPLKVSFIDYLNNRTATTGDYGPEGIIYIQPEISPIDTALLVLANEVSATLTIYKLSKVHGTTNATKKLAQNDILRVYPNPVSGNQIYFNSPLEEVILYHISGTEIMRAFNASFMNIRNLEAGVYLVKSGGKVARFIKK